MNRLAVVCLVVDGDGRRRSRLSDGRVGNRDAGNDRLGPRCAGTGCPVVVLFVIQGVRGGGSYPDGVGIAIFKAADCRCQRAGTERRDGSPVRIDGLLVLNGISGNPNTSVVGGSLPRQLERLIPRHDLKVRGTVRYRLSVAFRPVIVVLIRQRDAIVGPYAKFVIGVVTQARDGIAVCRNVCLRVCGLLVSRAACGPDGFRGLHVLHDIVGNADAAELSRLLP